MRQYIDIVKQVLYNGKEKFPVRKNAEGKFVPVDGGVKTLACANVLFSHDMEEGFPLLTTKKMAWKSIRVELEGFLNGITDKKWYQDQGCKIWNQWANPLVVDQEMKTRHPDNFPRGWDMAPPDRKEIQAELDDLGPIYGYQWRSFGERYDDGSEINDVPNSWINDDGCNKGYDQLQNIVDTLRENPMDRRMVCSAWNPNQIHMMALPPCHYAWNVTVIGDELNLFWVQRSCDLMLGVPFNIASYALLLELLARDAGLTPGNLSGMLVDCHIYENQIEAAKEQITRTPKKLPRVGTASNSSRENTFDIFAWKHYHTDVHGYESWDKINFGEAVV